MTQPVQERSDAERSWAWALKRAGATRLRTVLSIRSLTPPSILRLAVVVALLAAVVWVYPLYGAVLVACTLLASGIPVLRRLRRGRVWEAHSRLPNGRDKVLSWAVVTPHGQDRHTWRIDVVLRPGRGSDLSWVEALLPKVHEAADVLGVSVQSMDPDDEPVLERHGYLPSMTLMSKRPVLQRFPPAAPAVKTDGRLSNARQQLSQESIDVVSVGRLAAYVLDEAEAILAAPIDGLDWSKVVLRRSGQLWELMRSCAACLDGYVESLAIGRLDPASIPGVRAELDRQLDRLADLLRRTAKQLRLAMDLAAYRYRERGGQPLEWAMGLANLEIEGLLLSGIVAAGRRGSVVSLGIIDPEIRGLVEQAARAVQRRAREVRRSAIFDPDSVIWWARAIAGDALDLCGRPAGRVLLARAIRRLKNNELHHVPVTPLSMAAPGHRKESGLEEMWSTFEASPGTGRAPVTRLASVSATRFGRIGVTRGVEGLRQKRYREAMAELTTNMVVLILAGVGLWLFVVATRNSFGTLVAFLLPLYKQWHELPPLRSKPVPIQWELTVSSNLALSSSLALLAVVITGAVAVAVASPRESSMRAWSRDRAWQVFVVGVGQAASAAAVALAIAPLPQWRTAAGIEHRAEVSAAILFALLTAAGAASMSALQSRLDEWQTRRRMSLAAVRLRRANDRLGPPPPVWKLMLRGVGCLALCLLPIGLIWVFVFARDEEWAADKWWALSFLVVPNALPLVFVVALFVLHWASTLSPVGRIAGSFRFVLLGLLVLWTGVVVIDQTVSNVIVYVLFLLSAPLIMVVLLVVARRRSRKPRARTGPGTFALHLAVRLARWSHHRATV
jgi:hypothetical protein